MSADNKERGFRLLRRNSGSLFALGVALLTTLALVVGHVSVTLGDDALLVGASFVTRTRVDYDDILSANLTEDLDFGSRVMGVSSWKLKAGQYLNDQYGGYSLYAYAKVPTFIDIRTEEGHLLFNAATPEDTRALYQQLVSKLPDVP